MVLNSDKMLKAGRRNQPISEAFSIASRVEDGRKDLKIAVLDQSVAYAPCCPLSTAVLRGQFRVHLDLDLLQKKFSQLC